MKENRQGCLSRFIRTQTGPLRRLCAPQCTKKKKTPKGVFFFLEGTVKIDISDLEAIVNEILIYCSFNTII